MRSRTLRVLREEQSLFLDAKYGPVVWGTMFPEPEGHIPCFTLPLMEQMTAWLNDLEQVLRRDRSIQAVILRSNCPGFFGLGGDLKVFQRALKKKDEKTLLQYAYMCVPWLFRMCTLSKRTGVQTLAFVRGKAYGGAFENALAHDRIYATEDSMFSCPERLFGSIPGMGAFTFLRMRVGEKTALDIIDNARRYSAGEMHELGVVDCVVDNDISDAEIAGLALRHKKQQRFNDISMVEIERELYLTTSWWASRVLELDPLQRRIMSFLRNKQEQQFLRN
jgi:DSF synthase